VICDGLTTVPAATAVMAAVPDGWTAAWRALYRRVALRAELDLLSIRRFRSRPGLLYLDAARSGFWPPAVLPSPSPAHYGSPAHDDDDRRSLPGAEFCRRTRPPAP
jgi:hypothetical protein